jgi:phosphatidylinositol glycan class Z
LALNSTQPIRLILDRYHVDDGITYTTHAVFYKTYLPPHHLFGYNSKAAQSRGVNLRISDWREKSRSELIMAVNAIQEGPGEDTEVATGGKIDRTILASVQNQWGEQAVLFRKTGPAEYER